jgi:hypothetical protein
MLEIENSELVHCKDILYSAELVYKILYLQ